MLLKNNTCIVTGAGKGIGRAVVEAFLREGAFVIANDREKGSLDDLRDNPNVIIQYYDVSDSAALRTAFMEIRKERGGVDVLVNNAGIMKDVLIGMAPRQLMEELFAVNVFGTMEMMQNAAKLMIRQKKGCIINFSSIVGITGNPGQMIYSATKGAIIALTKTAAKELGPRGIRVNAIAPGMIDTDMLRSMDAVHLQKHIDHIPCGRLGRPQEIAEACVFLASEKSSYINGHILQVDAGITV